MGQNCDDISQSKKNSAFDNLLGKQSSVKGRDCFQSNSLAQSDTWSSAASIPALGPHLSPNEFRVAPKNRLGVFQEREKMPFFQERENFQEREKMPFL